MIAIDTNLLVYAHRRRIPEHERARRAIERAAADPRGWGIVVPCVAEFWSVVTHPSSVGGPSPGDRAAAFLHTLFAEAGARAWLPRVGFWERLTRLALDLGIQGPRIFDVQIALTAFENGATELWTHDRGFVTCPGLAVRDPLRSP